MSGFQKLENSFFDGPSAILGISGVGLYVTLRRFAGEDGECYPSIAKLCEVTGMARMTLIDNMRRLEEANAIVRIEVPGHPNKYKINEPDQFKIRTGTKSRVSQNPYTTPPKIRIPTPPEIRIPPPLKSVPEEDSYKKTHIRRLNKKTPVVNEKAVDSLVPTTAQLVWIAYAKAYSDRYSTPPIRNAKVNSQIVQFTHRVPEEEAPSIAAFYVWHDQQFYVSSGHSIGLLLKDAEKLHTEWITGKRATVRTAREKDRLQGQGDVYREIMEEQGWHEPDNTQRIGDNGRGLRISGDVEGGTLRDT